MKKIVGILALATMLIPATVSADFVNGDFETGDFSGWTVANTANGTTGTQVVINFDIDGPGPLGNSLSAQFQVGQVNFNSGVQEGIEMTQSMNLVGGIDYTFGFDWAATRTSGGNNAEGGVFSLIVNGTAITTQAAGTTSPTSPNYGQISGMFTPGANGVFEVGVRITRPFLVAGSLFQNVDNFTMSSTIPEPSGGIVLASLGLVVLMRRRKT